MAAKAERSALASRLIGTAVATMLSLAGTMWVASAVTGARVDRDPVRNYASLPGDNAAVVRQMPDAVAQLRRTPIDVDAFNLVYVAIVRRDGVQSSVARRAAGTLTRYGWRSVAAQQNLIEAAAYRGDFAAVLDHVDALLRRDKQRPQMSQVLAAIEKDPSLHSLVVKRLLGHPNWRKDYLWRVGETTDSDFLSARFKTLMSLLDHGDTLSRDEVSRSIQAFLSVRRDSDANRLWSRVKASPDNANLIYDPQFKIAQAEGLRPAFGIPYEWTLLSGANYSVSLQGGSYPLKIDWSGATAGLPIFARQVVAMPPSIRNLRLQLTAERPENVQSDLQFTLSCGANEQRFSFQAIRGTTITYALTGDVPTCLAPTFTIGARSGGTGGASLRLSDFRLFAR